MRIAILSDVHGNRLALDAAREDVARRGVDRIVNLGSVGAPGCEDDDPAPHVMEAGAPHAAYAIAERTKAGWSAAFHHVVYDWGAMSRLAASNGRP
jgi:diadenosine tetraphosphatase ApaH/serine/threonine PP2A family protein phosphatase